MESVRFRERISVSFPDGTAGRIQRAAAERGMKVAQFVRQAVLDRLPREESNRKPDRSDQPGRGLEHQVGA